MGKVQEKRSLKNICLAQIYFLFDKERYKQQFGSVIFFNSKLFFMLKRLLLFTTGLILTGLCFSQEKPAAPAVSVSIYGFIRNDMNYDSRQNVFVREGQLDLYPKDKDIQSDGKDYNKKSQLNILGILL